MFPHEKMPAFMSTSGFVLVEGAAIARYCEYDIILICSIYQFITIHMQSLPSHQNPDSFQSLLMIMPFSTSGVISLSRSSSITQSEPGYCVKESSVHILKKFVHHSVYSTSFSLLHSLVARNIHHKREACPGSRQQTPERQDLHRWWQDHTCRSHTRKRDGVRTHSYARQGATFEFLQCRKAFWADCRRTFAARAIWWDQIRREVDSALRTPEVENSTFSWKNAGSYNCSNGYARIVVQGELQPKYLWYPDPSPKKRLSPLIFSVLKSNISTVWEASNTCTWTSKHFWRVQIFKFLIAH